MRGMSHNHWLVPEKGNMRYAFFLTATLIAFTFYTSLSTANDAPIKLMSGSAAPYLNSSSKIRMDSEIVEITLHNRSYVVDATFNFINSGDTVSINVGFPKRGQGYLDDRFQHADEFIRFEAWVNGSKVDVSEMPGKTLIDGTESSVPKLTETARTPSSSGTPFAHDYRWMVRKVDFPAGKKTVTRVRYEAAYQDFGNCYGARYIYGTGMYWDGNIGSSKFAINCAVSEGVDMCWDQIQDAGNGNKYKVTRKKIKKDVVQYEMKNYKPDADDQIFMTVGCPD